MLFLMCFCFFLGIHKYYCSEKNYTVVIDAGHGGTDPGNIGNGYREKNIALKISLKVGKILKKQKGIKSSLYKK